MHGNRQNGGSGNDVAVDIKNKGDVLPTAVGVTAGRYGSDEHHEGHAVSMVGPALQNGSADTVSLFSRSKLRIYGIALVAIGLCGASLKATSISGFVWTVVIAADPGLAKEPELSKEPDVPQDPATTQSTSTPTPKPTAKPTPKQTPPRKRKYFYLYGIRVHKGFADPQMCPWLNYNYICWSSDTYRDWLQTWAAQGWRFAIPNGPLPPGISLWLGTSHMYETATALMCQHHWELRDMEVLNCSDLTASYMARRCLTKVDAYHTADPSEPACRADLTSACHMGSVASWNRCDNRAYPNVWGPGGTHEDKNLSEFFPMANTTSEDLLCGEKSLVFPQCSYTIQKFHFSNGHTAILIHNHALQFYGRSLQQFAYFLDLDMRQVNTIVYGSPWEQQFAIPLFRQVCSSFNGVPESPTFFVDKFREDIIEFAHGNGFAGNLILTTWYSSDSMAKDIVAAREMEIMAKQNGIEAVHVFPLDVVRTKLNDDWCGPSSECFRDFSSAGGHQCIPSVPDVVAWDIYYHMKSNRTSR